MQDPHMFWVTLASGVGTWLAAILFYRNLVWLQRSQKDKEFVDCAIAALEAAYNTLTGGQPDALPRAVRISWLEAARQIEHYKKLKGGISSGEYQEMCKQSEAAYRYKFHCTISRIPVLDKTYFSNDEALHPASEVQSSSPPLGLEPRSLLVLYDFAQTWPKDDPILSIDVCKLLAEESTLAGQYGLKLYLNKSIEFSSLVAALPAKEVCGYVKERE